ncbi:DEAD/DEAH box helicase, partial [bacterium]|nr:DEAD/DEAH box helicase [candidate division CSSED10-310 bacterium]
PDIRGVLAERGITILYSHQRATWDAVRAGGNPIVVTPTASGKTLCYTLPVLDILLNRPDARALYLFPTKALAQDQLHDLTRLTARLPYPLPIGLYDGDTPADTRKAIRESARIVMTNPDMLHAGILPHHSRWSRFFHSLAVIVIDELHHYRGVFGSHCCNVLRRMLRICRFHGSDPQFIMSSATLANPEAFAGRMIGRSVTVIDESGAPAGRKTFIFYNPPLVDPVEMIRRSYLDETVRLTRQLLEAGIQTIVFTRSRHTVELIVRHLRQDCRLSDDVDAIRGYRGGYLPRERRRIEEGLRQGRIRCVVSTSALELGVDIGAMGAVILAGYPGTVASTWQRAGRAGRRDMESLTVFVASAAPLDQFIVRNPEYFFGHPVESGLINPDNLLILLEHIRCGVFEVPFEDGELYAELGNTGEFLEYLEEEKAVCHSAGRWFYTGGGYPAERIGLRSISRENVIVVDDTGSRPEVIGEIDAATAPLLVHPEAVYLHDGREYVVQELDWVGGRARVAPMDPGYFTVPLETVRVQVLEVAAENGEHVFRRYGDVSVITRVEGYRKMTFGTRENLGVGELTLPEQELVTASVWFTARLDVGEVGPVSGFRDRVAGFIGALTAIHSAASVILMCDPRDIGTCVGCAEGYWTARTDHLGLVQITGQPPSTTGSVNLFIYDRYPGGIGLSEHLFRKATEVVHAARIMTERCDCRFGCPACIGPVIAGEFDGKYAAISVLRVLSGSGAVAG